MKEKFICIVTPEGRSYYHATRLAKEFLDKDNNIIHTAGTLPQGEVEEFKTSTKTIKHYKNGKLDGELSVIDLTNGTTTFSEQYKNGVLIDLKDHSVHTASVAQISPAEPLYKGTIVKVHKGTQSFYIDGKEVAEQTVSPTGAVLEQLGNIPDGPVKEFDENNQPRMDAVYKNNRIEGTLKRYTEKGQLLSEENFVQGVRQGQSTYYLYTENLCATIKANYKNSQLNGEWTMMFPDGNPHVLAFYQNGKLQGTRRTLYTNGQTCCEEIFENGKLQGPRRLYFTDGHLWYEENYKNGRLDGDRFCFFPNGQKQLVEYYADGLLEGVRQLFSADGNLVQHEEYHWGSLVHNTETKPLPQINK